MSTDLSRPDESHPRRHGKMHYHEEIVRPIRVARIVHKKPHADLYDLPERGHPARDVDLPLRTIQLHVARLDPGCSTRLHKHHNEAAIYCMRGRGYTVVQGVRFDWEEGDFLYMPPMQWHTHVNESDAPAFYLGITNKRMLDWLGLDRKVEAGIHLPMEEVEKEIRGGEFSPYSWYNISPDDGVRFGPEGFIRHVDK